MSDLSDVIEFSPEVRLGNEKLVKVTIPAAQKLTELMDREKKGGFLRIRITGGGCNGLSYKMKFVGQDKTGDIGVLSEGIHLLVDSKTALYLRGTTLEFSDNLVGGGFKFSNPNAKASCSCGESFNL
ncbi:iron-sulfur cluster assembly accessory protein [Verrucomicrobia bacterium]|nr:iron-sulfur cluster assembly accessory protein [Verrucomicrobiota bacterium]